MSSSYRGQTNTTEVWYTADLNQYRLRLEQTQLQPKDSGNENIRSVPFFWCEAGMIGVNMKQDVEDNPSYNIEFFLSFLLCTLVMCLCICDV